LVVGPLSENVPRTFSTPSGRRWGGWRPGSPSG